MNSNVIRKFKKSRSKEGFTLIEILVVMIIIGILASGMALVAGGSRDIAEATRIASDLKNAKVAAMMWVVDDPNGANVNTWKSEAHTYLDRYLDKPISTNDNYKFETITLNDRDVWLLGYNLSGVREGVIKKLAEQAESVGLFEKVEANNAQSLATFKGGDDSNKVIYVIVQ